MRFSLLLLAVLALGTGAFAGPIVWTLNGVAFGDGGTASGTLTFNPDGGTACGSISPCGVFSAVNIVTTAGSALPGQTYSFVCGQDVPTCNGVSPDSSELLLLTSNAANQIGLPAFAIFFTPAAGPPAGLTDAGGAISLIGLGQETSCNSSSCAGPAGAARFIAAGTIATPEPGTWALLLGGLTSLAIARKRAR